jgi:hypothetical protein
MNLARWLDEQGPDFPEATVRLVDALGDYLRAFEELEFEVQAQSREHEIHKQTIRMLLADLKEWHVDPSLGGRVKRRRL